MAGVVVERGVAQVYVGRDEGRTCSGFAHFFSLSESGDFGVVGYKEHPLAGHFLPYIKQPPLS